MSETLLFDPRINVFWEGRHGPRWCEPGRFLYDCELVYVSAGACRVTAGGRTFDMTTGDLLILPPRCWHETWQEKSSFRHCIHFDWTQEFSGLISPLQVNDERAYNPKLEHRIPAELRYTLPLFHHADDRLRQRLQGLFSALRENDPESALALWPVLRTLLADKPAPAASKSARAVFTVKALIESRYPQPLCIDDFCAAVRLTRGHLCTIFKAHTGMAPMTYLNHVRLLHARHLLEHGGRNIAEIAAACGIPDANYFARLFRKHIGVCPSRFHSPTESRR